MSFKVAVIKPQNIKESVTQINDLYQQTLRLSQDLDKELISLPELKLCVNPKVNGKTFREQLEIIERYLKILDDKFKDDVEIVHTSLDDGVFHLHVPKNINNITEWLTIIIEQCKKILEKQYEPGGTIFQQLQERNVGTHGMNL